MPRLKRRSIVDPTTGKRKLTRTWYAWVPDGRGSTRLVSTHCTDKKAAEAAANDLERCAVDPTYASAHETSIERVLADYAASRKRMKRAEATLKFVAEKSGHIKRVLVDAEGVRMAKLVNHPLMLKYVDRRQAEGASNSTILKELGVFKAAWRLARRNGYVGFSADDWMPELESDGVARTRWLTPWEVVGIATVLHEKPHRMAVVAFAVATGCDASALWRARREDVAPDRSWARIHGTKRKSRERTAHLPLPEQRSLLDWAVAHADGTDGVLFTRWGNIRRDLADACTKLGIPRCSPNDLRRSYAKWLRNAGIEPALVGPAMGHADGRMVERVYGKMTDSELGDVMAKRLAAMLPPARLMSGEAGQGGTSGGTAGDENAEKKAENVVHRGRVERPTRGFSIRDEATANPEERRETDPDCPANVRRSRKKPAPRNAQAYVAVQLRKALPAALRADRRGTLGPLAKAARVLAGARKPRRAKSPRVTRGAS